MKYYEFFMDNPLYLVIFVAVVLILILSIWKKLIKLIITTGILLLIYFVYLYLAGSNFQPEVEDIPFDSREIKKKVDTYQEDMKKKAEKAFKEIEEKINKE